MKSRDAAGGRPPEGAARWVGAGVPFISATQHPRATGWYAPLLHMTNGDPRDGRRRSAAGPAGERIGDKTVLTRGTRVSAQVAGDEIILQGWFRGEALGRCIRVESTGEVDASLTCDVAEILGRFQGTIEAEVVRFGSEAVADGVFHVKRVTLIEGAIVNGSFNLDATDRSAMPARGEAQLAEPSKGTRGKVEPLVDVPVAAAEHTTA